MGAEMDFLEVKSIKPATIKAQFEAYQEEAAYEDGHSYSGRLNMCPGLDITAKTFDSYDEAEEWLMDNCLKCENAKAVFYKDGKSIHCLIGGMCSS
jgi:hypothetical protein